MRIISNMPIRNQSNFQNKIFTEYIYRSCIIADQKFNLIIMNIRFYPVLKFYVGAHTSFELNVYYNTHTWCSSDNKIKFNEYTNIVSQFSFNI